MHQTKAELKEVATGYLASYSDAWPHFIADATSLMPALFTELQANLLGGKGTAATLLADAKTQVENQMRTIYEKFRDLARWPGTRSARDRRPQSPFWGELHTHSA